MIKVYDDINSLSRAAADIFAIEANMSCQKLGRFSVMLAGGETPMRTYELLAQGLLSSCVPWKQVHVFWGDERCVPANDPRSNYFAAKKAFLSQIPVPDENLHPIRTELPSLEAAGEYESQLRRFFGSGKPVFDLVILGLGEDGHTASLFPGMSEYPEEKWVVVTSKKGEEIKRISLTPLIINMASKVLFLVSGKNKSSVLKDVLLGPFNPQQLPAQQIKLPEDKIIWFVDSDAYSLIKSLS